MRLRDWRLKAAIQGGLARIPFGTRLNYLLQRASGGLPVSDDFLDLASRQARSHIEAVERHLPRPVDEATFYEFGAGYDLHVPIGLWSRGVDHQEIIDIRPLVRPRLVADIARRLDQRGEGRRAARPIGRSIDIEALQRDFGIHYVAPCDATRTGFPASSIDVITSTSTLEHIPTEVIASILRENRRILADDGIMSFRIDYEDHYAHFDPTISVYHFLGYDDSAWRRYDSDLLFQNRLRHDDYLELFDQAGLTVIQEDLTPVTDQDLADLAAVELADRFRGVPPERLAIRGSHVVLRPT